MNRLVIEQGTILDRIDFNIDCTYTKTVKAKEELIKVKFLLNIYLFIFEKKRPEILRKAQEQTIALPFWLF